jgi:threonine dehydratase
MTSPGPAVSIADIRAAAGRIDGLAVRTPLIESPGLNARTGGRILLKAECLQRTGSFKFRGAYNRISQLDPATTPGGVVAYSSGNHAQGVAAAAQLMGLPAVIAMPSDTPAIKRRNTEGYGADVVSFDRAREDREEIARAIAAERGAVIVPPFDDVDIIAGQGTAGLEIVAQAQALGAVPDAVLVCHGGGGFTAGVATAVKDAVPDAAVYGVEPEGFDDLVRSLASGRRERNARGTGSICDALLAWSPGEITFGINRQLLAGALAVSDDEVRAAMAFAFETLKLVVEPGGAVALAAVLSGRIDCRGRTVVAVLSGGNVDRDAFHAALAAAG